MIKKRNEKEKMKEGKGREGYNNEENWILEPRGEGKKERRNFWKVKGS